MDRATVTACGSYSTPHQGPCRDFRVAARVSCRSQTRHLHAMDCVPLCVAAPPLGALTIDRAIRSPGERQVVARTRFLGRSTRRRIEARSLSARAVRQELSHPNPMAPCSSRPYILNMFQKSRHPATTGEGGAGARRLCHRRQRCGRTVGSGVGWWLTPPVAQESG